MNVLRKITQAMCLCAGWLTIVGCARPAAHYAIETMMTSAYRPSSDASLFQRALENSSSSVLAGDMHCHVSPPDHPMEASRDPAATIALAREEGLDFVVLTPHVPARFFMDDARRQAVVAEQDRLREMIERQSDGRTTFIIGMEYTDHAYGHVGAAFADLRAVLADVSAEEARVHPEKFFESFVRRGGFVVLNHPLSTPLGSSISIARADLSWRPFTSALPVPGEIAALNRLAVGVEAYNMVVTHLRDRYLLGDTPRTLLDTMRLTDRQILAQERRLVPVGGSDSHHSYLRPTTFIRAKGRSESAIRDALASGRVCIRSPQACSFEARAPQGTWQSVGAALPRSKVVEARAFGGDVEVIVNGEAVANSEAGQIMTIPLHSEQCSVVRARVGDGLSAPIYVGCAFAQ